MGTPGINLGNGIDITLRDAIASTISPKIKQIADNAETAELKLTALQGALSRINVGNLSTVTTASGNLGKAATTTATAITRIGDAAQKADGNLQRFAQTLTVVTFAANQAAQGLSAVGTAANSASNVTTSFGNAANKTTANTHGMTAKVYEASAALRTLEGSIPIRAAERFLTMIPGMSAALSAAFPIFGALAVLSVLGQMIEKVVELTSDWGGLKKISGETIDAMLKSEDAEIKMNEKMLANRRESAVLAAKGTGPHEGAEQRGRAAGAAFDIGQDKQALIQAAADYETARARLNDAVRDRKNGVNTDVNARLITQYGQEESTAATGVRAAQQQYDLDKQTKAVADSNDRYIEGKAAMAAYKAAQAELVNTWRTNAAEISATSDDIGADLIHFWSMTAVSADKGSISQKKAFDELIRAEVSANRELQRGLSEFDKQTTTTVNSLRDQIDLTTNRDTVQMLKTEADGIMELQRALDSYQNAKIQNAVSQAETNATAREALGLISQQTAEQQTFNAKLEAYNQIISDIESKKKVLAAANYLDPNERKSQLTTLQGQENSLNSQKNQLLAGNIGRNPLGVGDASVNALRKAFPKPDFLEVQQDFQKLFTTIGDGFADSLAHSIVYATSLTKALQNVARQGLQEIIAGLIKMAIQWAVSEAVGKSLQAASIATTQGMATATAAAWAPAAAMASLATFGANAAAADAALSSTLALADGLSFAGKFARGGLIGGRGGGTEDANVILASRGEYVVNAKSTAQHYALLNAINNGAQTVQAHVPVSGASKQMHVTVEDHTLGGTTFNVNHINDDHVRIVARQVVQNESDGHIASAIANPNSRTSKAITLHTQATRRRNG